MSHDVYWYLLRADVNEWARENRQDDFYYGSPYSYWSAAMYAGVITQSDLDLAEKMYGHSWHYRGD